MNLGHIMDVEKCVKNDQRKLLQKACDQVTQEVRQAREKEADVLLHTPSVITIDKTHALAMRDAMAPIRAAFSGRIVRRLRTNIHVLQPEIHNLSLQPNEEEKAALDGLWNELEEKDKKRALSGGQVSTPL